MGNFASRIHSKEDNKIYNILPMGNMPTVVFGRVIREHSVPGMQYYFSDGRVKFEKEGSNTMSNNGGWDAVIPFTKQKEFSAIKLDTNYLYRRHKKKDRTRKGWYAWAYVFNSDGKDISDTTIDWTNIDTNYDTIMYTNSETPEIGDYDVNGDYEILDSVNGLTVDNVKTQLPVIFTVPENLDYSKMNDVEYVKQFCRVAKKLNANTMSSNFVIRNGKIICEKEADFGGNNKILTVNTSNTHSHRPMALNNKRFVYKFLYKKGYKKIEERKCNNYHMCVLISMIGCLHNEFSIIPTLRRGSHKIYQSNKEYPAYRYRVGFGLGGPKRWKWKLK